MKKHVEKDGDNSITAIPTFYSGAQFKSRMEAQCACLFDKLGWEWEYEPWSLMLPSGLSYTPDFWIDGDKAGRHSEDDAAFVFCGCGWQPPGHSHWCPNCETNPTKAFMLTLQKGRLYLNGAALDGVGS
jgi:hypothetical protein